MSAVDAKIAAAAAAMAASLVSSGAAPSPQPTAETIAAKDCRSCCLLLPVAAQPVAALASGGVNSANAGYVAMTAEDRAARP